MKKKILTVLLIIVLFCGFLKNGSYMTIEKLFTYLAQDKYTEADLSVSKIETEYASNIWHKKDLINLNGAVASKLKMQGFYSNMGMYVTDNNYIVSTSPYTNTDYEYKQTVEFRDFLKANGVNLLYVNKPTKYLDDNMFREKFGVETYSNRNADRFLSRIKEAGVNTIDLRNNIVRNNGNIEELFYRTDHHWTVPAGLWATKVIARGLNNKCGYNIDTTVFNKSNFTFRKWKACWLGEQGRKIAESYVGLDDFTEIKPKFETNYSFIDNNGYTYDGTFDNFINEEVYNTEKDVYENESWHYSYNRINCINNNVEYGKVLLLGDSYDQVTQPFLSLGVHQVDSIIMRNFNEEYSLRNYILQNEYDTVIIAYAQFMIGAHDDPTSSNYRMFSFEK